MHPSTEKYSEKNGFYYDEIEVITAKEREAIRNVIKNDLAHFAQDELQFKEAIELAIAELQEVFINNKDNQPKIRYPAQWEVIFHIANHFLNPRIGSQILPCYREDQQRGVKKAEVLIDMNTGEKYVSLYLGVSGSLQKQFPETSRKFFQEIYTNLTGKINPTPKKPLVSRKRKQIEDEAQSAEFSPEAERLTTSSSSSSTSTGSTAVLFTQLPSLEMPSNDSNSASKAMTDEKDAQLSKLTQALEEKNKLIERLESKLDRKREKLAAVREFYRGGSQLFNSKKIKTNSHNDLVRSLRPSSNFKT